MLLRAMLAMFLLAACDRTFTPVSFVDNLRVLGVRAEPPELRPGQSAQVTALLADPDGGGRAVTVAWGRCDPGIVTDLLKCQNPNNVTPLGVGASITVTAPADYLSDGDGGVKEKRLFLLAGVARAGEEQRIFYKEIDVRSTSAPLNQNPVLESAAIYPESAELVDGGVVQVDGGVAAPLTSLMRHERARIIATVPASSREMYTESNVQKTEEMQLAYFATAGELELVRTVERFDDVFVAPDVAGPVTFWIVLRDGRNGTDWKSFTVDVR